MSVILKTQRLSLQFGGVKAVNDLDLHVDRGQIVALIGPNGAGKTTVFNLLTGVYAPSFGDIQFLGQSLLGLKPDKIARLGISRTFQNIRLFRTLNVLENVRVGLDIHDRPGLCPALLRTPKFLGREIFDRDRALQLLAIFNLHKRAYERADQLPYGDQRRLEMARALATGAKLLLLDEPAAGLNGQETADLMKLIVQIRREFDLTILLIEHDMKLVMGISDTVAVLDYGVKIAEGPPRQVAANPHVIEAYLGRQNSDLENINARGQM